MCLVVVMAADSQRIDRMSYMAIFIPVECLSYCVYDKPHRAALFRITTNFEGLNVMNNNYPGFPGYSP